jgi:hypothetical protein
MKEIYKKGLKIIMLLRKLNEMPENTDKQSKK